MKGMQLDENEQIVAAFVQDTPEQLSQHKNQIVAVTNKRLLYCRKAGLAITSIEQSYDIDSIDIRTVRAVRLVKRFAIGGALAGLIALAVSCGIAYGGMTGKIVGPGVIFIPLFAIPTSLALIFGVKRRVLLFETTSGNYKWTLPPFASRKDVETATSLCEYFDDHSPEDVEGTESWATQPSPVIADAQRVQWYHYVVIIFLPVAVVWGIVNLIQGKKRSGLWLLLGTIVLYVILLHRVLWHALSGN
jgi:hypothetical protein